MFRRHFPYVVSIVAICALFWAACIVQKAEARPQKEKSAVGNEKTKSKARRRMKKSDGAAAKEISNSLGMRLMLIPTGTFVMGSPAREDGREAGEVQHSVKISRPFYMANTEVTQAQWKRLMNSEPSDARNCGQNCPVERVSWFDAVEFCNRLSLSEKLSPCYLRRGKMVRRMENCNGYRLPTEAEWEYAARAGSTSRYCFGNDLGCSEANTGSFQIVGRSLQGWRRFLPFCMPMNQAVDVGLYPANLWGLHDMHGNVAEWCHDFYRDGYEGAAAARDPLGPEASGKRVLRGGSFASDAGFCRCAARAGENPGLSDVCLGYEAYGFRCVRRR